MNVTLGPSGGNLGSHTCKNSLSESHHVITERKVEFMSVQSTQRRYKCGKWNGDKFVC